MDTRQLREKLQSPRRAIDTFYGKHVMRFFSIYLTAVFIKTPASPTFVTVLSILVGLAGAYALAQGHWFAGLLGVNGWYLLDHVDGEIARFKNTQSVTGFYFDTLANVFVMPTALAALGAAVSLERGAFWTGVGVFAAYSSVLLLVVGYCESVVFCATLRKKKLGAFSPITPRAGVPAQKPASFAKKFFSMLHTLATFPAFLMTLTGYCVAAAIFKREWTVIGSAWILLGHTVIMTVVWFSVLARTLLQNRVDAKLETFVAVISEKSA